MNTAARKTDRRRMRSAWRLGSVLSILLAGFPAAGCGNDPANHAGDPTPAPPARTATTTETSATDTAPAPSDSSTTATPAPKGNPLTNPSLATETSPDTFTVRFDTTKGPIDILVEREWAPRGADRFYNLVRSGFFAETGFFRLVEGFVVQFGIHGDPKISAAWRGANIHDDPVKTSNKRGTLTFATSGKNSRTTQLFINYGDNGQLDGMGFSPIGKIIAGMSVVDDLHAGYGETPDQSRIQTHGNAYLKESFPDLDYITSATIVE